MNSSDYLRVRAKTLIQKSYRRLYPNRVLHQLSVAHARVLSENLRLTAENAALARAMQVRVGITDHTIADCRCINECPPNCGCHHHNISACFDVIINVGATEVVIPQAHLISEDTWGDLFAQRAPLSWPGLRTNAAEVCENANITLDGDYFFISSEKATGGVELSISIPALNLLPQLRMVVAWAVRHDII